MSVNQLIVTDVNATRNTVRVDFESTSRVRKFFDSTHFFAEYDLSLETVPPSILVIPFLSAVLPITWANDVEVRVPEVDSVFFASLNNVKETLARFYPTIPFNGVLRTTPIPNPVQTRRDFPLMLFGGGIDALATYLRHRNEHPHLLTVHGTDIHPDNYRVWTALCKDITAFSATTKAPLHTVRSNFKSMLDEFMLHSYVPLLHGTWYTRVMHGLALLGLCAPITYAKGMNTVYIASTFTKAFTKPWGSDPQIDNHVAWAGTHCLHDGYELSRQQKIRLIADYVRHEHEDLPIHSCWTPIDGARACNHCSKCGETIIGLESAGLDPNNHGFTVTDDTFHRIKQKLATEWAIDDQDLFMWTDLQRHAKTGQVVHPQARVVIEWLQRTKLTHRPARLQTQNLGTKVLDLVAPLFPYLPLTVYTASKRVLIAARSLLTLHHTHT